MIDSILASSIFNASFELKRVVVLTSPVVVMLPLALATVAYAPSATSPDKLILVPALMSKAADAVMVDNEIALPEMLGADKVVVTLALVNCAAGDWISRHVIFPVSISSLITSATVTSVSSATNPLPNTRGLVGSTVTTASSPSSPPILGWFSQ